MTLFAFLLGLALGIGFCLWQQNRLYRQLQQIVGLLPTSVEAKTLPLVARLRQGIVPTNQHLLDLEIQLQTWQQLLREAPVGYLQVDEENQLIWCNAQARSLLQIHRWEPRQIRLLLELVRSYELDQLIEHTRQQQQPQSQEWMFHPACSDATAMSEMQSFTLRASSWPLPHGQVGVFLENRQPLVEVFQSHERWISDLAHELRTPLTSIRLVAESLQNRLEPPWSRWVDQMLQETNRLIHLVQDWLTLTQLQGERSQQLTLKPLELRSLIYSVWHTLEPLARQKQLNLTYFGLDAVWLKGDKDRLTQVFLNLLHNSIKYSPLKGSINVEVNILSLEDAPQFVEVNMVDSGPGFPEPDLPHVFERLYRGDPARTRQSDPYSVAEELDSPAGSISGVFAVQHAERGADSQLNSLLDTKSEADSTKQLEFGQLLGDSMGEGESQGKDTAYSFSTSGSGLGLAIVRQIIVAHGGSVVAKNHSQTGGAWLQVQLPLV